MIKSVSSSDHMWHQITRSPVISLSSLTFRLNIKALSNRLQELRGLQPVKFATVWHFCKTFACMWEFVMCVYDSFWVTAVPLGALPGQWRRVYVWVCVCERASGCVFVYVCVCLPRGDAQTWALSSDESRQPQRPKPSLCKCMIFENVPNNVSLISVWVTFATIPSCLLVYLNEGICLWVTVKSQYEQIDLGQSAISFKYREELNNNNRKAEEPRSSWSPSRDLPLIGPPAECQQIRLMRSWSTWISAWVSPTSRAADGEQISRTLPPWSQLSCQHVCDRSGTHRLWLRMLPVEQMENQHHLRALTFWGDHCLDRRVERRRWNDDLIPLQLELFLAALWGEKYDSGRLNVWLSRWV